jgi:hypothetical protein
VFCSVELQAQWAKLDAFGGERLQAVDGARQRPAANRPDHSEVDLNFVELANPK